MNINGETRKHLEIYTIDHMVGKTGLRVKIENLPIYHLARTILVEVVYDITRAVGGGAIVIADLFALWNKLRVEAAGRVIMHDYTAGQAVFTAMSQGRIGYLDGQDQGAGVTPYRFSVVIPVCLADLRISQANGDPDDSSVDTALLQDNGNVVLNFGAVPAGFGWDTCTATVKVTIVSTERRHAQINPWPEYLSYNGQPNVKNLIAPAGYVKDTFVKGHGLAIPHVQDQYVKYSMKAHGDWVIDEETNRGTIAAIAAGAMGAGMMGPLISATGGPGFLLIQTFTPLQGEVRKIMRSPNDDMIVKIEADPDVITDTAFDVIQTRLNPADDTIVNKTKIAYNLPANCPTISRGGGAAELDPLVPYYYAPELIGK